MCWGFLRFLRRASERAGHSKQLITLHPVNRHGLILSSRGSKGGLAVTSNRCDGVGVVNKSGIAD